MGERRREPAAHGKCGMSDQVASNMMDRA